MKPALLTAVGQLASGNTNVNEGLSFLGVRLDLKQKGAYDGSMLKVMAQQRCKIDATRPECAEGKE